MPAVVRCICSARVVGKGPLQLRIMDTAGGININMPQTIYEKTPAGRHALLGRASGLPLEARRVLILINGRKTIEDLRGFVDPGHLDSAIDTLLTLGYIHSIHDSPRDFNWIKKEASTFTSKVLGDKANAMCEAIERTKSTPELRKVLQGILIFVDARLSPDITLTLEKHYRAMLLLSSIDIPLP